MKKLLKYGAILAIVSLIGLNLTKIFSLGIDLNEKTGIGKDLSKTLEYVIKGIPYKQNLSKNKDNPADHSKSLANKIENDVTEREGEVDITFIDVGQGDSTLIIDNNRAMLIDAGNLDSYKIIKETLHQKGINTVDVMVLTHPDLDHIGSAVLLLAEFDIPTIYMPDVKGKSGEYSTLISATNKRGTEIIYPVCGNSISFGSANYTIYCTNNVEYEDINSYSLIVRVVNGEDVFLLTGDATGEEVDSIISKGYDLTADVFKAAHHGSANCGCNSETFIKKVNPKSIIVSCGKENEYGHPHIETMNIIKSLGIDLYRTDIQGSIDFISTGNGIACNTDPTSDYKNGNK